MVRCQDFKSVGTIMGAGKKNYQKVQTSRALSSTKPHQPHLGPPPTPVDIGALFNLIPGPPSFQLSYAEEVLVSRLEAA